MEKIIESTRNLLKNYKDYLFFPTALLLLFVFWQILKCFFPTAEAIQVELVATTLLVLFHAIYIKDDSAKHRNRPILNIELNFNEPDCHLTQAHAGITPGPHELIPAFFIRFRVKNTGRTTAKKVEVIVEKVSHNGSTVNTFVPLNLTWSLTEHKKFREYINIPQGMYRIVDFLKIMHPTKTARLSGKLGQMTNNPIAETHCRRFSEMSHGIGICATREPNNLSDILNAKNYKIYLTISSDNTTPSFARFRIDYNGKWIDDAAGMFKKSLKVKLEEYDTNKNKVFQIK